MQNVLFFSFYSWIQPSPDRTGECCYAQMNVDLFSCTMYVLPLQHVHMCMCLILGDSCNPYYMTFAFVFIYLESVVHL